MVRRRRQNNLYTITHSDGHQTQVVASNIHEVANAIHTFKMDAITIQRVPSGDRTFRTKKI